MKANFSNITTKIILLSIFVLVSCSGQNNSIVRLDNSEISFAEVDSIVNIAMEQAKIPGLQLAILNNSKVKYMRSYGFIDSHKTIPIDNNTVIQLASISKSIFACIVMKLVEEGKFDLDKPVFQYLDFPTKLKNSRFDYLDLKDDERYKKISGRMLLTHTAGFKNWRGDDKLQIYFEPGTQYYYSGEGIIILQGIIEHITKIDLRTLSEDYIFKPLEMNRTSFVWQDSFNSNASFGFKWDGTLHNERKDGVAMAAYSGVSSISDQSKLITAILNNNLLDENTTVTMLSSHHEITTKNQFGPDALVIQPNNTKKGVELSYGLGWGILNTPEGQAFFKEGNNPGAKNISIIFKNGTGLIIMTNSDRGNQVLQYLNEKLIGNNYFPWKWESIYPFYVNNTLTVLFDMVTEGENVSLIIEKYNELKLINESDEYTELIYSSLGYGMLRENKIMDAIEIFKLNVELYPTSSNVYDSLGEAFMKNGNNQLAIKNYEKSLELDPKNTNATQMIKKIKS